eukprot:1168792-Amphidinium_carterae.1
MCFQSCISSGMCNLSDQLCPILAAVDICTAPCRRMPSRSVANIPVMQSKEGWISESLFVVLSAS